MRALTRLKWYAFGQLSVAVLYFVSGQLALYWQRAVWVLKPSRLDACFAFYATAIWLYVSFWLLILLSFFLADAARVRTLAYGMFVCALLSAGIYVVMPTSLDYGAQLTAVAVSGGLSTELWQLVHGVDNGLAASQNCLPSLHAAISLLCAYALGNHDKRWLSVLWLLWAALVVLSVLWTGRHLLVDVAAGLLLALVFLAAWHKFVLKKQGWFI